MVAGPTGTTTNDEHSNQVQNDVGTELGKVIRGD